MSIKRLTIGLYSNIHIGMKSNDAKNLLILADFLAAHKGWKITTVGLRFAKSGSFFTRLREGKNFTVSKRDYVIQRFSDQWPSDLAWPSDIPRPKPGQSPDRPVKEQAA